MTDDERVLPTTPVARSAPRGHYSALTAVLLLAAGLHFFRLEREGYGNLYYAAAVKSMLANGHNFFFAAFDPAGFVSVDKPPLGLWVQAASAALFGFDGWSLHLPQALAGVLSVAVLYVLVRRAFGLTAGLIAALVLAVTPISVAADRNNTMDGLLVLTSLLAAWAASLATEKARLRWLLLAALLVGIGFNVKMLQALLVLPALFLLYLIAAPIRWWKRLAHLALATIVLLVVSLAWPLAVDLTPPEQRPFVGSSRDNTVMELIVGHNGLARLGPIARLLGSRWGGGPPGGPPTRGPAPPPPINPPGAALPQSPQPNQPPPLYGGPRILSDETGGPGPLRLFNRQLGGQISWLLPMAGVAALALLVRPRVRWPLGPPHQAALLWVLWLAPQVIFFSFAGLFHRYYLEMLAPAIAALAGAGLMTMWQAHREGARDGWLLAIALVVGAATEAVLLAAFPDWARWLTPIVVGLCGLSAGALLGPAGRRSASAAFAALGLAALLVAPTVWAAIPVWVGGDSGLPFAGPELLERPHRDGSLPDVSRLAEFLSAHRRGERFLAAALNANTAAPLILATGEPVMAMGGFSGGDRILSVEALAAMASEGEVRFFLLPAPPEAGSPSRPGPDQQAELLRWIGGRCAPVDPALWQTAPRPGPNAPRPPIGPGGTMLLFDCGPA